MTEVTETKGRESFIRLAEARVNKTIKDIRLIANLSNKSNYKYTDKDIRDIFSALERELKRAKERFAPSKSDGADGHFKLRE